MAVITTIGIVGTDFANSDRVTLNEKSLDYILQMKGMSQDSGFETIANTSSGETADLGILDSEENLSVLSSSDFLSTFYIKKERASQPTNFFKLVYNIPTNMVLGLGLPLSDFSHIINIFTYIIFIAIIIMIWTRVLNF